MPLLAIREKISRLSRSYRLLLLVLLIFIFIITAEGFYYLSVLKNKTDELRYINTGVAYQEGVFLHSKENIKGEENEPIAIRGRVAKIDWWFLTIENQGQQVVVEIDKNFEYTNITGEPKRASGDLLGLSGIDSKEEVFDVRGAIEKRAIEKGLFVRTEHPQINELSQLVNMGDFVVISRLNSEKGRIIKGSLLSILGFMKE
jgi:hypothetical protein